MRVVWWWCDVCVRVGVVVVANDRVLRKCCEKKPKKSECGNKNSTPPSKKKSFFFQRSFSADRIEPKQSSHLNLKNLKYDDNRNMMTDFNQVFLLIINTMPIMTFFSIGFKKKKYV
jgi:hypothetical protein